MTARADRTEQAQQRAGPKREEAGTWTHLGVVGQADGSPADEQPADKKCHDHQPVSKTGHAP